MRFPVLCMDCGEETRTFSDVEGSTGLCGRCPRSRERLGLEDELERDVALEDDGPDDFDPVAEDLED
jgi:hypothetical protein